jgi:4-amino-4-deoxy-L-arabinose transferase-like glycosyltransferase
MAVLLTLIGLLLPAQGTALTLVGAQSAMLAEVVTGVWIFKIALLVHALLLFAASQIRLQSGSGQALTTIPLGPARPGTQAEWGWAGGLLLAALLLRVIDLNDGLWFDEIRTLVGYVRQPAGHIVATYDSQNQHLLYSLLGRPLLLLFGESSWALRLPAVLFGTASLAALYWFGTLVATRREALLATALLTVSYHHIWFSQNARGYTALLLCTLIASGLLLKLVSARTAERWPLALAYAVVMALAVFTHVTAAFIVVAHVLIWCALLWHARGRMNGAVAWLPLAGFALATTLSLQLYALALPQFLHTLFKPTMAGVATDWKNPLWFLSELIRGLSQGIPGGLLTLAVALVIGLAGLFSYVRKSYTLAAIMLLPGLLTAAAVFLLEHNLWPRFFFFCAGFAVLIAVRGIFVVATLAGRSRAQPLATALLLVLCLGSAITVPRAWAPKQDFVGARDFIEGVRAPTDAVVTVDLARYPFDEYLNTGWLTAASETELERIEASHGRTWVLYTFPARLSALQPGLWQRLQRDYSTAAEFAGTVGGGAIIVKVRS